MKATEDPDCDRIDDAVGRWKQGDCTLGEHRFLFRFDLAMPLTPDARMAAAEGLDTAASAIRGLMVATQTCDIVRSCSKRPFIEVCPLVEVDELMSKEIRRGLRPGYAFIPGVAEHSLVADLDRVMTVEKSLLTGWTRTTGCRDREESRLLALALARKRARVAFPDEFVSLVQRLSNRFSSKHDKANDEGRTLQALLEIRVKATPSWEADEVALLFWFIRDEDRPEPKERAWHDHLDAWLKLVPPSGRFAHVDGLIGTLDDLTARDYAESDPLDLDHLSTREP